MSNTAVLPGLLCTQTDKPMFGYCTAKTPQMHRYLDSVYARVRSYKVHDLDLNPAVSNWRCDHIEAHAVWHIEQLPHCAALLESERQLALLLSHTASKCCISSCKFSVHIWSYLQQCLEEESAEQSRQDLILVNWVPTIMSVLSNFLQQIPNACQLRNLLRVHSLSHLPRLAPTLRRISHLSQYHLRPGPYQVSTYAQALPIDQVPCHD